MLDDKEDEVVDSDDRARVDVAKQASALQILFRCARRLDEIAVARIRAVGGNLHLRTAHTALLPHIDLEGTRLTEIARRLGVTKQAVGPLVDDLVQGGLLERVPDPVDRRAKLVRFRGVDGLLAGLAVLHDLEDDVRDVVGERQWGAFTEALRSLQDAIDAGRLDAAGPSAG